MFSKSWRCSDNSIKEIIEKTAKNNEEVDVSIRLYAKWDDYVFGKVQRCLPRFSLLGTIVTKQLKNHVLQCSFSIFLK